MRGTAYYCTVEELQKRGRDDIPEQYFLNAGSIDDVLARMK
jgi:nitrogenase molybdenum-cofactor synthesis protein NifE